MLKINGRESKAEVNLFATVRNNYEACTLISATVIQIMININNERVIIK
jgi:hypothetical protein